MKKLILTILICSLIILTSCKGISTAATTPTTPPPTVEQLKAQIDDLSLHMSATKALISSLQQRLKNINTITTTPVLITTPTSKTVTTTTPSTPEGPTAKELSDNIDFLTINVNNIASEISALQDQMVALQDNLKGNATNIGLTSQTVNGLSILFITNDIDVGSTGSTTPGTAQFAIKITNITDTVVSNIDITGTITSAANIIAGMPATYPQVTDASGLCTIAFANAGTNIITFEAYGSSGKGSLSIPIGGSITIRPKISILAVSPNKLSPTTFTIALKAITYDGPVK